MDPRLFKGQEYTTPLMESGPHVIQNGALGSPMSQLSYGYNNNNASDYADQSGLSPIAAQGGWLTQEAAQGLSLSGIPIVDETKEQQIDYVQMAMVSGPVLTAEQALVAIEFLAVSGALFGSVEIAAAVFLALAQFITNSWHVEVGIR